MPPDEKPTMKQRILETADLLFYQRGIRAVGVDTIAAEIGISKRTLENWEQGRAKPNALTHAQATRIRPLACIQAINTMRGCALNLTVVGNNAAPACAPPPEYSCSEAFTLHSGASTLKACD